jgi:hypothetical protein
MVPLEPGGASNLVTFEDRHRFADLVERFRLTECWPQLSAMRQGMVELLPAAALVLFTAEQLERLVVTGGD